MPHQSSYPQSPLWPWIEQASKRLHGNMLAIALANKLAHMAWAVLAAVENISR
jgi:transposase